MGTAEDKLAGVDRALLELGKSDEEITEVRNRYAGEPPGDLEAVDAALDSLGEDVEVKMPSAPATFTERAPAPAQADDRPSRPSIEIHAVGESEDEYWEGEDTNIDVVEESDFVLLVDEDELEDLEAVGEADSEKPSPPSVPPEAEEGEGFFKKLFGGRSSSNRPQ